MFKALAFSADFDCAMICGYIVKVHRAGQGAKVGTQSQSLGTSSGGITT